MKQRYDSQLDAIKALSRVRGLDIKGNVISVKSGSIGIRRWGAVDYLKNECRFNVLITY